MKLNKMKQNGKLSQILFIDRFPKLDLHGYDRETARVMIEDFIRENQKLKHEIFIIVHGIGQGILRAVTYQILNYNSIVVSYQTPYENSGCTIVEIQIDK